jgi:hypothetical protein
MARHLIGTNQLRRKRPFFPDDNRRALAAGLIHIKVLVCNQIIEHHMVLSHSCIYDM